MAGRRTAGAADGTPDKSAGSRERLNLNTAPKASVWALVLARFRRLASSTDASENVRTKEEEREDP